MNKVYEEFGKFFLNVSVAIVVFVFIQPFMADKFNPMAGLIAIGFLIMFMYIAYFLLKRAGSSNVK